MSAEMLRKMLRGTVEAAEGTASKPVEPVKAAAPETAAAPGKAAAATSGETAHPGTVPKDGSTVVNKLVYALVYSVVGVLMRGGPDVASAWAEVAATFVVFAILSAPEISKSLRLNHVLTSLGVSSVEVATTKATKEADEKLHGLSEELSVMRLVNELLRSELEKLKKGGVVGP